MKRGRSFWNTCGFKSKKVDDDQTATGTSNTVNGGNFHCSHVVNGHSQIVMMNRAIIMSSAP